MNTRSATTRLAQRLLRCRQPSCALPSSPCRFDASLGWRAAIAPPARASSSSAGSSSRASASASASPPRPSLSSLILASVAISSLGSLAWILHQKPTVSLDASSSHPADPADSDWRDPQLPRFRVAEVRKHDATSPNPWIIHGNKVYDITEWIPAHPGGEVILRAAGGPVDRYWDIFSIHKAQYVYDILEHYLIGYVDPADLTPDGQKLAVSDQIEDPFADDPARHADLITLTAKPRNAETPGDAISDSFLTPNDLFYVRNHMWVPTVVQPEEYVLTVELADGTAKTYTLKDLKTRFRPQTVTAVLQCSGNRRSDMSKGSNRPANGLPWKTGAISNAAWEGVLLADVLADAGFDAASDTQVKHVQFAAMEAYGASIPIRKAIDPQGDVLLAWGMNGQPLPRDHGFPLRSIVPGHVAARSVKWLNRVTLSDEESPSQWQRRDYKCFGPNETKVDWDAAPSIQEMPVQSAITSIRLDKATLEQDKQEDTGRPVSLSGYAYSGGGRAIVRVDVSLDGGATWSQAQLLPDDTSSPSKDDSHGSWSWKRWRYDGMIPRSVLQSEHGAGNKLCTSFVCKATDESYNTQPQSHAATWNVRGNLATAWHRVRVCADCKSGMLKQEA